MYKYVVVCTLIVIKLLLSWLYFQSKLLALDGKILHLEHICWFKYWRGEKTITFRVKIFCLFCTSLTNHLYYYKMYNRLSCLTSKHFQLKITSHIYFGTPKKYCQNFSLPEKQTKNKLLFWPHAKSWLQKVPSPMGHMMRKRSQKPETKHSPNSHWQAEEFISASSPSPSCSLVILLCHFLLLCCFPLSGHIFVRVRYIKYEVKCWTGYGCVRPKDNHWKAEWCKAVIFVYLSPEAVSLVLLNDLHHLKDQT